MTTKIRAVLAAALLVLTALVAFNAPATAHREASAPMRPLVADRLDHTVVWHWDHGAIWCQNVAYAQHPYLNPPYDFNLWISIYNYTPYPAYIQIADSFWRVSEYKWVGPYQKVPFVIPVDYSGDFHFQVQHKFVDNFEPMHETITSHPDWRNQSPCP